MKNKKLIIICIILLLLFFLIDIIDNWDSVKQGWEDGKKAAQNDTTQVEQSN